MLSLVLKESMQVCGRGTVAGSWINEFQMELAAKLGSAEALYVPISHFLQEMAGG